MADLEAQTDADAQIHENMTVTIPRRKLRELVHMLSCSVEILRETVEPSRQTIQDVTGCAISPNPIADPIPAVNILNKDDNIDAEKSEATTHLGPIITVVSPEEVACHEAGVLKAFEGQSSDLEKVPNHFKATVINKQITADSWKVLQYLDWSFYSTRYTVAESRADAAPGQRVPNVVHHYMKISKLRLATQKQLYHGLSRWWWVHG